jgi:hypothetical protein
MIPGIDPIITMDTDAILEQGWFLIQSWGFQVFLWIPFIIFVVFLMWREFARTASGGDNYSI